MELTDEEFLKRFMALFEWDHNEPWKKSNAVSNIYDWMNFANAHSGALSVTD
jgi:hypothetical protein